MMLKTSSNPFANSLRLRIQATLIIFGVVAVVGLSLIIYSTVRNTLIDDNFDKLTALRETRSTQLQLWFADRRADIETLSENPYMIQAARDFDMAVHGDPDAEAGSPEATGISYDRMRDLYLGQATLADAGDNSVYSRVHAEYFPVLQDYLLTRGYYDLFIVDNDGDIVFSVVKEDDFATGLNDGPYSDTNIATAFRHGLAANEPDFTALVDFEFYAPSQEPAMFMSSPIFDDNEQVGTLIFQIPVDILDEIMNERAGLGESGETYLVGNDFRFRNDSRVLGQLGVDTTILSDEFIADTQGVNSALSGNEETAIIDDYRGIPVLSSWKAVTLQDALPGIGVAPIEWALMSEIGRQEVLLPVNNLLILTVVGGLLALVITTVVGYLITRPLEQLVTFSRFIQDGDLSQRAPVNSNDEIGQLATALNRTLDAVANRTRDVEAIVDVSARAASTLDEQRLLQDVVDLTKERFGLYHAHIYRMNDTGTLLQLAAGAGYIGRQMVAEERVIPLDQKDSIVARTARNRTSNVVNEVRDDPEFLPHPLLPKTRAELSVPLVARGRVLGVLDVQSDTPGYFDQNALTVMQILAEQVSTALSNVQLLDNAQRQNRHAQALNTIQQSMQSAQSMDEMLQTTAREIAKALRVPYTSIQLGLEDKGKQNEQDEVPEGVN